MPRPPKAILQSYVFKRDYWKLADVRAWLRDHGQETAIDTTAKTYRARQRDPKDFVSDSFRTVTFRDGVEAVIGHLRPGKR